MSELNKGQTRAKRNKQKVGNIGQKLKRVFSKYPPPILAQAKHTQLRNSVRLLSNSNKIPGQCIKSNYDRFLYPF